jgi:hypothetical protein
MVETGLYKTKSFALDTQAEWLDFIFHEYKSEPSLVWAVSGITQGVGYSTMASILFAELSLQHQSVSVLSPDGALSLLNTFPPDELFARDPNKSLKSLYRSLDKTFVIDTARIWKSLFNNLWKNMFQHHFIIDLGASISPESLDVFLSADVPLIVMDSHTETVTDLVVFLNACLLRLLEVAFPKHRRQLYTLARQISKKENLRSEIMQLVSSFHSYEPKLFEQIRSAFSPRLLLNRCSQHDAHVFHQCYMNNTSRYYLPDVTLSGAVSRHPSASALSSLKKYFIHTPDDPRLADLENCLKQRFHNLIDRSHSVPEYSESRYF